MMTGSPDSQSPETGVEIAPGVRVAEDTLRFKAVRSSGPGGQNVNKVSTKVELRVNVASIPMSAAARDRLRTNASHLVTTEGELVISCDEHRSQQRNRQTCLDRLRELLVIAMTPLKPRKKTKPTAGSKRRRLDAKRRRGDIKRSRQSPGSED